MDILGSLILFFILFGIVFFLLWLWVIVDILQYNFEGNDKIIWLLVVFFLPVIGTILYFMVGRSKRIKS